MSLPETMQALILTQDGFAATASGPMIDRTEDWLELKEVEVPKPGEGQALIAVRRASVNPSDIHFIKGEYGQKREQGRPAGMEGCGDVIEGPDHLKGKRVAFVAGPGGSGAWAQYAVADANACIPLRDDLNDTDGAAQIVNPLTAMAMVGIAEAEGDAFIATALSSQLGKLMCGLAKDKGLQLIGTVRRDGPIDELRALGATQVLNTEDGGFEPRAREIIRDLKPKVMLDAVTDQLSERMFLSMPFGGRWITYGKLGAGAPELTNTGQFIFQQKRIEGFWLNMWFRDTPPDVQAKTVAEVQARFADGRWSTDVSAELSLGEMMDRLPDALRAKGGKVVVNVGQGG